MKPKIREKQILVLAIGLPLLIMFLAWRHYQKAGVDVFVVYLIAMAVVSVILFVLFRSIFERFFDLWMKVTGCIGAVVTTVVLALIYFIVFTPVSAILRLTGKDFMSRKWDKKQASYWTSCEQQTDLKEKYLNQF